MAAAKARCEERARAQKTAPERGGEPARGELRDDVATAAAAQKQIAPLGFARAPAGSSSRAYGLAVGEGGLGLFAPPGSTVMCEPEPPVSAGLAVVHVKDGPPRVWDLGHDFRFDLIGTLDPTSSASPMLTLFEPITGRAGQLSLAEIAKIDRVCGIYVPGEASEGYLRRPAVLPVLPVCPEGMGEHVADSGNAYPAVRQGETVIYDPARQDPQDGALCVVQWNGGRRSLMLTNLRQPGTGGEPSWWADPVNRPGSRQMLDLRLAPGAPRGTLCTSDGPYTKDHLRSKIVGAVVGILVPGAAPAPAPPALPDLGVDRRALVAYASWLYFERSHVLREMYPHLGWKASTFVVGDNAGFDYHRAGTGPASGRAVAVLSAVGCDWSQDGYLGIGDGGVREPQSGHFPHPDARLMDLETAFLVVRAEYDRAAEALKAADETYDRREAEHAEAERDLVAYHVGRADDRPVYFRAEHVRRELAGEEYGGSVRDHEAVKAIPREALEAMLSRLDAREKRRAALSDELDIGGLEEAESEASTRASTAAQAIYRLPAHTLEGLALKARVLRIDWPELWQRPGLGTQERPKWHEIALADIAAGVEHLLSVRGLPGGSAVHDCGQPGGLFAELTALSGGVEHDDGIVCFTDAAGKVLYKPVPEWISHWSMRLWAAVRREQARQLNDPALTDEARAALAPRLRLNLRVDAIHALAFRHVEACALAEAEHEALVSAELPVRKRYANEAVSPDLLVAIEAHREAVQLMVHDSVEDDERTNANCDRVRALKAAIRDVPVRSLADLRWRMLYLWPEITGGIRDDEAHDDLIQLQWDVLELAGVDAETVQPEIAPLPAPGSEEAKAAYKAACHEHTILTQFANEYPDLKRTPLEWWTAESLGRALETGELPPAEVARLYPLATERELRMAAIEHRLRLGSLHALAFADTYPVPGETAGSAADPERDLSALTLNDLAHLHMAASALWTTTSMFLNAPFSWDAARKNYSPLGSILETEVDRWEGLATLAAKEAAEREPQGRGERDRRLEIATQHAMLGGGPIDEPGLVAEIAQAWGA